MELDETIILGFTLNISFVRGRFKGLLGVAIWFYLCLAQNHSR